AWTPLLSTPNHPEYPAAHGCVTAALADALANALGTQTINATVWGANGGATTLTTTAHFDTAQQLKDEIVNARVWAGVHWRSSVVAGENVGDSVASWSLSHYLRTTFVPNDETCFHVFESADKEAVAEVCRRAGIGSARIVQALE